ncbi:uncharacterized protein CBL_03538 [Carabus blaptoides fortunei]
MQVTIVNQLILDSLQLQFYIPKIFEVVTFLLFLLDAIREMRKYSHIEIGEHTHLDAEMQGNMRLFRAQRNFYISGFALFLSLVIRRLVILISDQAVLLAQSEAAIRQAQSASSAAKSLLAQRGAGEVAQNNSNEDHDGEVTTLKDQVKELEMKLAHEIKDKLALKNQSENLHKEYDRLTDEYSKLQKKVTASDEDRKDE